MRNSWVVLFLFWTVAALLSLPAQDRPDAPAPVAQGHVDLRRYELGFETADIRTFCVGQKDCYLPAFSVGAAASLNWSPHLAFDTSVNVTTGSGNGSTNIAGGRTAEVLAGVRGELRARRYGYYAKLQPGFVYWNSVVHVIGDPVTETDRFLYGGRTRFVTDAGGGMEFSLTPRVHLRGEFTDLVMRYSSTNWLNDFQPSAGVWVGVGRTLAWKPPVYTASAAHPFFDATNIVLLTASVLGMTADAITTQRGIAQGRGEADPLARPLVKYGWSGQIPLEGLETGAEILATYGLHRIGHHRVERSVPLCVALTHAIFAYNNASSERKGKSTAP